MTQTTLAHAVDSLTAGNPGRAARILRQHLAQNPADPDACNLLGMSELDLRDDRSVPAGIARSLAIEPGDHAFLHNLGLAALRVDRLTIAGRSLRQSLAARPEFADAHLGLGNVAARHGDYRGALRSYDRAVVLAPDHVPSRQNRGWARLALGDFDRGFRDYAWRWRLPIFAALTDGLGSPRWDGRTFDGTLLLIAEQGFGDTLQFCRLARLAAERASRVILEVQPELTTLIRRSLPGVDVVGRRPDFPVPTGRPAHDRHAALLDLPSLLDLTVAGIPGATPYLRADSEKIAAWATRLQTLARGRPRIGLVWAGNPRPDDRTAAEVDRRRSLPLSAFAALLRLPDLVFFSLQKGSVSADIAGSELPLHDLSESLTDFDETAAAVAGLDLVLTVDTAVAHLAGALGRPTWVMSRADGCWRWLTDRADSPWYPTLRLFRQRRPGDWTDVIESIRDALPAFATRCRARAP